MLRVLFYLIFILVSFSSCSQKFDEQKLIYYERCKDTILAHFDFFMNYFKHDTIFSNILDSVGRPTNKKSIVNIEKKDFFCGNKERLTALQNTEKGRFLKDLNKMLWEEKLVTAQLDICELEINKDSSIYFTLSRDESSDYNTEYIMAYDIDNRIKNVDINEKVKGQENTYTASDVKILFSKGKWKYFVLKMEHVDVDP